ncbi:MAG TPA: carboxypeptidase-like regulatory domain-containing protein, partial [Puia sp.]
MKITALCMVLAGVHLSLWASSQKTITLVVDKEPLANVLSLIEQRSGYRFLYQYKEIYETKVVSLKVEAAPLDYVLSLVFKGTGLSYSINSNNLIVISDNAPPEAVANVITGIVRSERGDPLPNVSVLIKGTSRGTQTNDRGYYSIQANENDTLQFSFVGYETQFIRAGRRQVQDIILKAGNQQINEVVVVGYSDKKKSELTSA